MIAKSKAVDLNSAQMLAYRFDIRFFPYYLIVLGYGLLSIPVLSMYNGKRGKQTKYFLRFLSSSHINHSSNIHMYY